MSSHDNANQAYSNGGYRKNSPVCGPPPPGSTGNKLPSASNLGISSFLNNPSSAAPSSSSPITTTTSLPSISPPSTQQLPRSMIVGPPQQQQQQQQQQHQLARPQLPMYQSQSQYGSQMSPQLPRIHQLPHQQQQQPVTSTTELQSQSHPPQFQRISEQQQQQPPQLLSQQQQQQQSPIFAPQKRASFSASTQTEEIQKHEDKSAHVHNHPHHHHHHHHHHHPVAAHRHHHHHHHHHHKKSDGGDDKEVSTNDTGPKLTEQDEVVKQETPNQITQQPHTKRISRIRKPHPNLNIEPIVEIIKQYFPKRQYLGTIIYNPTTTWDTIQTPQLYGLKPEHQLRFQEIKLAYQSRKTSQPGIGTRYIPCIPALPAEYVNSIMEIKIPFRYLVGFMQDMNNGIVRREVWGGAGGIYTDDSDIVEVLCHLGLFDEDNGVDLSRWNVNWKPEYFIRPLEAGEEDREGKGEEDREEGGRVDRGIYGDLSVEILLLPTLPQYIGYYNHGINSRSWDSRKNQHSGLSYCVYNLKWEKRDSYLGEKSIYKRYEFELQQDIIDNEELNKEKQGWQFNYVNIFF
ncbi:uncharacterized protein J8A68_001042 [[Candida] subhashii]|uniref:Rxt3-domain-containing protein n=1 Tax=[Candida] subhashii TaxID=561895 RepID=A0A8J5QGJ3_9ASCO|nr:uncharacterized protein J8A68_001042 [[Candida] subhashii]KAG7665354.1 hypothetical protein J8A68_001042 [[Candida] subhashii]